MINLPIGKTMYIWILTSCAGGDMEALADKAVEAGFSGLVIKATDGTKPFGGHPDVPIQQDLLEQLIPLLIERGIAVHLWGWTYGRNWRKKPIGEKEAQVALNVIMKFPGQISSWTINAEHQYKERRGATYARIHADALRDGIDDLAWDVQLGLSSYRYPSYHREFPFSTFAPYIDFWNPQIYWMGDRRSRAGEFQLKKSIKELKMIRDIPIIPIGFGFAEHGYKPTVEQMDIYDQAVRLLGLIGISWWSWQHAEKRDELWNAISAHPWPKPVAPGKPEPVPEPVGVEFPLPELTRVNTYEESIQLNRSAINHLHDKIK